MSIPLKESTTRDLLPNWLTEQIVMAAKVIGIQKDDQYKYLILEKTSGRVRVDMTVDVKNYIGGYYVRYADGFEAWTKNINPV